MKRREFIMLIGGAAAAWPLSARAQQPKMPVVGFLISATQEGYVGQVTAVRKGLADAGFIDGQNMAIEYRWANEQYDRLPALAAELVRRPVSAIFATGSVVAAMAAKSATTTIPIVFAHGSDPVSFGLVASLARPGGNVTGVTYSNSELGPKRLELLRELLPKATLFAVLVNPKNPGTESDTKNIQAAARVLGVQILLLNATRESDLEPAFVRAVQQKAAALMVHNDTLFQSRDAQIVALAARHAMPTMYTSRRFSIVGGLISYGTNTTEMTRQAGIYLGRILKGQKPADLPILQPAKFELIVNLKTAKALGLKIPETFLLYRADEVIE